MRPQSYSHYSMRRLLFIRHYSPPRKLYFANVNPIMKWWNSTVPYQLKYFLGLGGLAWALSNVHYDIWITGGPPVAAALYFGYKYYHKKTMESNLAMVDHDDTFKFHLAQYDELLVDNVLRGIENEYDYFRTQVLQLLQDQIREAVVSDPELTMGHFFLKSGQLAIHLGDIDLFVFTNAPVPDKEYQTREFIKFSLPFYTSKAKTIQRGVVEVYLLETSRLEGEAHYNAAIDVRPYKVNSGHNWLFPNPNTQVSSELKQKASH